MIDPFLWEKKGSYPTAEWNLGDQSAVLVFQYVMILCDGFGHETLGIHSLDTYIAGGKKALIAHDLKVIGNCKKSLAISIY